MNACPFQAYLGDFIVSKQLDGTVLVNWTTISEHNNEYFTIEHSTDGIHFTEIGKISSLGNTAYGFSYQFIDNKPGIGKNFYRIRMVDITIKSKYSEIKIIQVSDNTQQMLSIFPNPAVNSISLKLNTRENEELKVEIYNVTGNKELTKTCIMQHQKAELDIGNLRTGIYSIVAVTSIGIQYTSKLIVMK
jgi:trimeric autotransporter adhesin